MKSFLGRDLRLAGALSSSVELFLVEFWLPLLLRPEPEEGFLPFAASEDTVDDDVGVDADDDDDAIFSSERSFEVCRKKM